MRVHGDVCAVAAVCVYNNNKRGCECIAYTKCPEPVSCQELDNKAKQLEAYSIQLPVE